MKITAPKICATVIITALGVSVFNSCPLWMGICFVIPGFSLFLRYYLKQDLEFMNNKDSINRRGYVTLLGCSSLVERKNKYGF